MQIVDRRHFARMLAALPLAGLLPSAVRATQAPDDPVLGRYASALSEGSLPRSEPGQTMQIAARLFGARMSEGAGLTERYLADSTQRECADEIFQPGLIRVRLIKEGKLPPLRE